MQRSSTIKLILAEAILNKISVQSFDFGPVVQEQMSF